MVVCKGECSEQDTGEPYHAFQMALADILDEELFSLEEFGYFNEVFLISQVGLLISHISRSTEEGIDEDILSSMLTAVQDFVKDSFGGGGDASRGGLGKLEYKDTKIIMEHGDLVYIAAVTSGEEHPDMKKDIRKLLAEIEETYFDLLAEWDGDLDKLSGTVPMLERIAQQKYRVKRSLDNIDLQAERLKVQTRIHELIEKTSAEKGLLLIIEDIHWADESTMMAIPYLARNILEDKIILCMTFRPEETEGETDPLRGMIDSISLESMAIEITLDRLDDPSLEALVSYQLNGGQAPEELLDQLKTETGGNPFFIIEVIRALTTEGTLIDDDNVWIMKRPTKDSIPTSVVELVSRRLEALDVDSLRLIESGAVLGRRFDIELLRSGFSGTEEFMNNVLDQLIDVSILDRISENEVRFQHAKIQEVIYGGMSERWKRMLHRTVGIALESSGKGELDDILFKLAYHFGRTREYEKGIEYSISAGYKAANNLAPREATQFLDQAICLIGESGRDDDRSPEIYGTLGDLYDLDGDYEKAMTTYEKLLATSDDKAICSEVTLKKGRVFQNQGIYDKAIAEYERATSIAEQCDSVILKAKINGALGKIYLRKGEYEKALALQTDYLKESKITGDKREIGQAYMNLGGVYLHLNDNSKAIRNWESALKYFEEVGYEQGVAYVNDNLGVAHLWSGKFVEALEYYEKSGIIMRKIGNVKGTSAVLLNIGVLYYRMGENEKSLEHYRKSLQIKKKIGDTVGIANIYNNFGVSYLEMGLFEDSVVNFKQNLELMEKSSDTWGIARSLSNVAEPEIELGLITEAREHLDRSIEIAEKHDFKDIYPYSYMLLGTIHSLEDDYDTADKYFTDSLRLARETEEPARIGRSHLAMARSMERRGERQKAIDNYASAFEVFEESKMETLAKRTRQEMQDLIDKKS